ncbi:hypothetical protein CEXT_343041 [Caerostris extrusa]|uniref:Uncharacterized protein n=1 Tax=Caerostris extrusa TaxID=172846 RepID=A0AAV4SE73_CAEEX|nr:hypothetical protein CEXT_343041 [Caerostris extrusa]
MVGFRNSIAEITSITFRCSVVPIFDIRQEEIQRSYIWRSRGPSLPIHLCGNVSPEKLRMSELSAVRNHPAEISHLAAKKIAV